MVRLRSIAAAALAAGVAVACGRSNGAIGPTPDPPPVTPVTAVLVGAGDIADCANDGGRHAEDTARLLDKIPYDAVFTAGDNAYQSGTAQEFNNCYHPRWGRHRARTRPVPGNHEYGTPGASAYFNYFGPSAGPFGLGYYSYNIGNWHIVALNSEIPSSLGGGEDQYNWLQDDLTANKSTCTAVYFHEPRFTSGPSGGGIFRDLWRLMYTMGVDIVINGHDHGYERFDPQDPDGNPDAKGIVQFVVGSGGAPLYVFDPPRRNSAFRRSTYGVLKLTLRLNDYDYEFIEAGTELTLDRNARSQACH